VPPSESVWDYPRPPRLEATPRRIRIVFGGVTIVDTRRALRLLETSHPPTYYVPMADVGTGVLRSAGGGHSICEWKGVANYFDVVSGARVAARAAWTYVDPTPPYLALRDHAAFYAAPMDACYVDEERVTPQPGGFYGGWITSELIGPFKGSPGTSGW
jgi:uncharacterized protein (DUF427 family)